MEMQNVDIQSGGRRDLDKRLEDFGWGIFLIMIGVIWLVPEEWVPQGTWLIGTGLLLLGLNAVRYSQGIALSGFTTVLGLLMLAAGIGTFAGVELPLLALCVIAMGLSLVIKPLVGQRA